MAIMRQQDITPNLDMPTEDDRNLAGREPSSSPLEDRQAVDSKANKNSELEALKLSIKSAQAEKNVVHC